MLPMMRFWCWCALILALAGFLVEGTELECPSSSTGTVPAKLKEYLLCNYDGTLRPVVHHLNTTKVTLRIIMKYFTYDVHSGMLSVDAWLTVFWKDHHLTWDPDEYSGIKSIHLSTDEIWIPDLSVYNRHSQSGSPAAIDYTTCAISYTGLVLCVPPVHIDALCVSDVTWYPFDVQNCTIRFGSWVHKGEEVDFRLSPSAVDMEDMEDNGEWRILDHTAWRHGGNFSCCPNSTYPSIHVSFLIKRLGGAHSASVIVPALVSIILTVTTLFMSPLGSSRLYLCCINLITGYLHVQYVSWMIPLKGNSVPRILTVSVVSLMFSGIIIVHTLVIKNVMERKTIPPNWISRIVSMVTGCSCGRFLFTNDNINSKGSSDNCEEDGAPIVNSQTNNYTDDWKILGIFLDRTFFLFYLIFILF